MALVLGAAAAPAGARELADLSLEELANIEVTSVSRRAERLSEAPASIFVITHEDIRRSGATSLPEVLRLAPNLQVARVNSSSYAISARGFNNSVGNKLLVLIDGRTVYTPLFSGVFWDAQDVMLEDVERIEVISGPGATLWGTNAVNGVINVTTRPASATQGVLASLGGGNRERGGAVRYGAPLRNDGHFRLYGKFFDRDGTRRADGTSLRDSWDKGQFGFRADWGGRDRAFTLQGDAYHGDLGEAPGRTKVEGANLLARWNQQLGDGSNLRVQGYYDRSERDQPGVFREELDTFDVELQHALKARGAHTVVWGAGYRYANDRVGNSAVLAFLPAERSLDWWNFFVQDEIALGATLALTLGARVEGNPYTGTELLPGARIAWKPAPDQLVWTALTRAVRSPARLDREFFIFVPPLPLNGGPNFRSEVSNVIEVGYRAQPSSRYSYSVTAFHHDHDHLRSVEPAPGGGFVLENRIEGSTYGVEGWAHYRVSDRWRLSGGGVLLKQALRLKPDSRDVAGIAALGNDPAHQWILRSSFEPAARHALDVALRRVGALPNPNVPSYTALDARWGWQVQRDLEISVTLINLFDRRHPEFGAPATRGEVERGVFFKMIWQH